MTTDTTAHQADHESPRRVPLLADTPLRDPALDRFGFDHFANALALIVDHERTATPLTIAVSAPWGGGKSSVGGMVHTLLERRVSRRGGDDPRVVCWFNAWEHADAPHLGAALAAAVAREANRHRSWWRRALFPLPTAMLGASERWRRTTLIAAVSLASAALLALAGPTSDLAQEALGRAGVPLGGFGAAGLAVVAILIFQRVFATAKSAARFIDDPRSEAARGTMTEVKQQLARLIRQAIRDGRLVILIDDLERCESVRALEVCQVASQLLAQPNVVTILLADMNPIAASAGVRYAVAGDGLGATGAHDIGRRYLEKIVQLELAMPPPDPAAMQRVIGDYGGALRDVESRARAQRMSLRRLFASMLDGIRSAVETFRRRVVELGERQVVPRAIERAGWWPSVVVFLGFVVLAAIEDYADLTLSDGPVGGTLFVLLLGAIAAGFWSRSLRREQQERRDTYKRTIDELKESGKLSPEEVRDKVIDEHAPERMDVDHELIGDLVSNSFLDSDEFRAVERFIATHPPRLPREGKRTFNQAQLLTEIARARKMFGGEPRLTPDHLAKWVLLKEHWPLMARDVIIRPGVLGPLETAAAEDHLDAALDASNLTLTDVARLTQFLREVPTLGDVIERLVYFVPAGPASTAPPRKAPVRAAR